MRDDQLPVDVPSKQCIDMMVADGSISSAKGYIIPVAHTRHQHDAEQSAQAEDRLALALGISVQCVGLNIGAVLQKAVEDMDGLLDSAGNEAGKKGNIVVGDMMVGDAAISAVSNVGGTEKIVLAQRHMAAVGNGRISSTPHLWQRKPRIFADDITHRRFDFVGVDVLGVDPTQHLRGGNIRGVTSGLAGAEIAAIAEDGKQVAPSAYC